MTSRLKSEREVLYKIPIASVAKRRARVALLMQRFHDQIGHPEMDLFFRTPFQLLVSVVLSAKVSDKMVNRVMTEYYEAGLTPETIVSWGEAGFLAKIRTIGLAPTKAKRVYRISQILLETFKGEIPSSREELEALPGVRRKTANVILGALFAEPMIAVDTHVFRVTRRLGLQGEANPVKAEQELLKVIDENTCMVNTAILLFTGGVFAKPSGPFAMLAM
jgi:endonuclease-3